MNIIDLAKRHPSIFYKIAIDLLKISFIVAAVYITYVLNTKFQTKSDAAEDKIQLVELTDNKIATSSKVLLDALNSHTIDQRRHVNYTEDLPPYTTRGEFTTFVHESKANDAHIMATVERAIIESNNRNEAQNKKLNMDMDNLNSKIDRLTNIFVEDRVRSGASNNNR